MVDSEEGEVILFLHSDTSKQCRKLTRNNSSRETDLERLGRAPNNVVCSVISSKSTEGKVQFKQLHH